jgi:hypothetical protein
MPNFWRRSFDSIHKTKRIEFSNLCSALGSLSSWNENCLPEGRERKNHFMLILLILLVVLLVGATPAWPYSRGWGYYPSGVLGTLLVIFLVLLLLGQVSL